MKKTKTLLVLLALVTSCALRAAVTVTNLRTESLETPLGIDEIQPLFSWQMASDRIGAAQTAYRVMVADDEAKLSAGEFVYDSGRVMSDRSLGISYNGKALRGSTRYFWKVQLWDEKYEMSESQPTWFETGLMGIGWNQAQWIGSDEILVSKYRTFFFIDFDVEIPEGNNRAVFVYSAQNDRNYISTELNLNKGGAPQFVIRYCVEGKLNELASIDVSDIINADNRHKPHKVHINVTTPGYHLKSNIEVTLDGVQLKNPAAAQPSANPRARAVNPYIMEITPYPNGERVHDWARLHSIGFMQPRGEKAVFSNITISEDNWDSVLYSDPQERHEVTGDGKMQIWEPYGHESAPMLRKTMEVSKPVKSARLYVTARGIYEFYINGRRVSNDYHNPGWTDYRYRIMYNSYDITDMIHQGANGLGAMLGTGWYSDLNIFTSRYVDPYGIRQSLMAKVLVTYEDGTTQTVVTDGTWKRYDHGPVVRNGFQFGEDYDARKEVDGWAEGSFDDSQWESAVIFERPAPSVAIQAYVGLPMSNNITLEAISVSEPVKGTFVYDLGQNIVGVPRIEGMKGKSGQVVNLRFGEMVYPDVIPTAPIEPYTVETYNKMKGQVYVENYRGALSIDNYIMRGKAEGESYQPLFTCHGFRYISITGLDEPLPLGQVKGLVLESIGNATSIYECSDENVNKLFQNIQWGQRGNFQTVPTDCPQRDERQGWTGDAQVFARTATYFSPWVGQFYARWLHSMRDNQHVDGSYFNYAPVTGNPPYGYSKESPAGWMGWMEAGIIVPWQVYQQYGDEKILRQHYDSMVRYMNYLEQRAEGGFIQNASGIGDHLAIERTDIGLTNTAYYAYDAYMMAKIAKCLGYTHDQQKYEQLYADIKRAFNETFVNEDGVTVAPYVPMRWPGMPVNPNEPKEGEPVKVDTQTSYVLPLYFDLFDEKVKDKALANLVKNIEEHGNTLTTGFIGTPYLNPVLSENGRDDVAYTLFEQKQYPSWLYPVLQGATTMWERWNSYTIENGFGPVDMNSFNHYAYGAIGEWMFAHSLGIQRDEERPGYKHIILQPKVGGEIEFARGGFESPYGDIRSEWEKTDKGYIYRVTIPANTTASLNLQADGIDSVTVLKGQEGVGPFRSLKGRVMAELKSGTYEFEVK